MRLTAVDGRPTLATDSLNAARVTTQHPSKWKSPSILRLPQFHAQRQTTTWPRGVLHEFEADQGEMALRQCLLNQHSPNFPNSSGLAS